jgi:hypothetical protein
MSIKSESSVFKFHYLVILFCCINISPAYACQCSNEDIALTSKYIAKIEILELTYIERIGMLFGTSDKIKGHEYKVRILDAIKGKLDLSLIRVAPPMVGNCSFDVKTSRVRYIFMKNQERTPVISVCNSKPEEMLKHIYGDLSKYIAESKLEIESPDLSKWKLIFRDQNSENFADLKNIVKNEPDHYSVWTFHNNYGTDNNLAADKSAKTEIKISCLKKMYSIKSEYRFSERNGGGDVVTAVNHAKYDKYHWVPIKKGYPLDTLSKFVCKQ